MAEGPLILRKVPRIVDGLVAAERNVILTALVEAAQTIIARCVQIIDQLCSLCGILSTVLNLGVVPRAMAVLQLPIILHRDRH